MIVGSGKFRYEVATGWERLPAGWRHGDVTNVVTDAQDRVYVFNRSDHPVIVYGRDGQFLRSWGEGIFARPHGISITREGLLFCTDDKDHTVRKFTAEGTLVQTLGTPGTPSDTGYAGGAHPHSLATIQRGAGPFNRPTRVAQAPNGELYIADGYGNARVHHFTAAGELLDSWGEPGDQPGHFNLPHAVWVQPDGRVFVCDRENDRVQIFDPAGRYLTAWTDLARPADLYITPENYVVIGELALTAGEYTMAGKRITRTCPSQVSIRDLEGNLLARWGAPDPFAPDGFASAHGIWVDAHGDIYVSEVAETALGRTGRYRPDFPSLKKFVRI
jgi:DNA-binding beta-propeller fold protein YncE